MPLSYLHLNPFLAFPSSHVFFASDDSPLPSAIKQAQFSPSLSIRPLPLRDGGSGLNGRQLDRLAAFGEPSTYSILQHPPIAFSQCTFERSALRSSGSVHSRATRTAQRPSRTEQSSPSSWPARGPDLSSNRRGVQGSGSIHSEDRARRQEIWNLQGYST